MAQEIEETKQPTSDRFAESAVPKPDSTEVEARKRQSTERTGVEGRGAREKKVDPAMRRNETQSGQRARQCERTDLLPFFFRFVSARTEQGQTVRTET